MCTSLSKLCDFSRVLIVGLICWLGSQTGAVGLPVPPRSDSPLPVDARAARLLKQTPVVIASATSLSGASPLSVTFTAEKSYDPAGGTVYYEWDFGDGSPFATTANPVHVFQPKAGDRANSGYTFNFTVRLTVIDSKGVRSPVQTFAVALDNPPLTAKITRPTNGTKYGLDKPTSYTLTAAVTGYGVTNYRWQVKLRHNGKEQLLRTATDISPVVDVAPAGCGGEDFYHLINLTVTSPNGLTTVQDSVKLYPDCSSPSLSVTNLTASPTAGSVALRWTNPTIAFDNVLVVGKVGSGFTDIPLDQTYTADPSFTGNGSSLFGGKVLYQGTGNGVTATNLTSGQTYFFRVYTRKGSSWSGGVEISTTPSGVNRPPVAVATSTSLTGTSPLSVTFTGDRSYDPDNDPITYEWDFGDDSVFGTTANPVHVFSAKPGKNGIGQVLNYTTKLTVIDSKGTRSNTQTFFISLAPPTSTTANRPPVAVATSTSLTGTSPLSVTFTGDRSYDPDNDPITYEWDFGDDSVFGTTADPVHVYTAKPAKNGIGQVLNYTTKLTVIDSKGARSNTQTFAISLSPAPPTPVTTFDPTKCYQIVSLATNKVLSVENSSVADNAPIRQRTDAGLLSQRWQFQSVGDGYYKIVGVQSSKAIDVQWWGDGNDVPIQLYTSGDAWRYNQHFVISANNNGTYQLTARHSGKALTVQNGNTDEGGLVVQYTPNGLSIQQWGIVERGCTTTPPSSTTTTPTTPTASIDPAKCYRIQSRSSGLSMSVPNGQIQDGVGLKQMANADQLWQKWRLTAVDGSSYYNLTAQHSKRGIQITNSATADNAPVDQWTYWGGAHQQWAVQRNTDGFYVISNRNSGKAVTVRSASTADGADIVQQALTLGQTHQQWSLIETTCPTGGRIGVDEVSASVSLSPNPAHDHVLIDLSPVAGRPVGVVLNDLMGRPMQQTRLEAAPVEPYRFSTGQLPDGLYLMQITPAGQSPTTLRLVIQR